ncbi:MAG: FAD-dependent thymidylate synthase [Aminobacteriaceae bacterium]
MSCGVLLLSFTPRPDAVVAAAARLCYSDVSASSLINEDSPEKMRSLLRHIRDSGHFSPFEHASFTFAIDGISRVTSHQLVRHRLASYSQQSQRYVSMDEPDVVLPPSIAGKPELKQKFVDMTRSVHSFYVEMLEQGVPKEDARYILPHGYSTRLVMTMNARELHHLFALRLCRRAQWEIRDLARRMLVEVRTVAPALFEKAGPACLVTGKCEERSPCGSPFLTVEELLDEKIV